jgi:hypothetical protein
MRLSTDDARSSLWLKLKEHFEERLVAHRQKNDNNLNEIETARLRGRIAETLVLLAMDQPDPANVAENDDD